MFPNNDNFTPPPPVIHHQESHITTGVIVPGLQAAITGVLSGVAALAVSGWLQLPAWAIGGTVAAVAMLAAWLSYRSRWAWLLEKLSGVDINGDQVIGQPESEPEPEPLRVIVEQDNGHQVDFIDLPVDRERATIFARGLLAGKTFAMTAWTGSAGVFSRSEYDSLVNVFITRGLAAWRNPAAHAQGLQLTGSGRALCRRLAEPAPLPSPHDRR